MPCPRRQGGVPAPQQPRPPGQGDRNDGGDGDPGRDATTCQDGQQQGARQPVTGPGWSRNPPSGVPAGPCPSAAAISAQVMRRLLPAAGLPGQDGAEGFRGLVAEVRGGAGVARGRRRRHPGSASRPSRS
jgi:hypothetical protein